MDESPSALTWLAVGLFLCVWLYMMVLGVKRHFFAPRSVPKGVHEFIKVLRCPKCDGKYNSNVVTVTHTTLPSPGKKNRSNPTSTHFEATCDSCGEVTQFPVDGQQFPVTSLRPPRPG
ncbi:hypothetical protein [Myxococcus qinghaiensis]|uniref:hypothetical protein n=1 Tax=Myxococcus qinghaiensis TaxID=2906758 RepID=UPI0020A77836|nr:hypothetical protein [Myxococcus qinghaiensis]MCP3169084.1 hypothetical protein [Myxococcus qinghaiensis]